MIYLKVNWKHEDQAYPVVLYSELDEDRWEVRKVEVFPDGRWTYASESQSIGGTVLGELPIPSLEEIAENLEFEPHLISESEFELAWNKAVFPPKNWRRFTPSTAAILTDEPVPRNSRRLFVACAKRCRRAVSSLNRTPPPRQMTSN